MMPPWQGRLLMESAQKQHLQRLIDFEFDDDGFIGCYRQSRRGKTVSRNRLERLGNFVRRRARELLRLISGVFAPGGDRLS